MAVAPVEAVVGFLLVFVLPGFTIAKAVFPDRRMRAADGVAWGVELAALTLVLSIVVTVLVGFVALAALPSGFSASWSDPTLEIGLGAVSLFAGAVGVVRGAYSRTPPSRVAPEPAPGADDGWEQLRTMERLVREERRWAHRLRTAGASGAERESILSGLEAVRSEIRRLRESREGEYAR